MSIVLMGATKWSCKSDAPTMLSMAMRLARFVLLMSLIPPLNTSEYVGNFHGDLLVQHGQAVYKIPIELPKGPNNIQPNLNLVYSSGGGNGPVGLGWSFDLISVISRCPQTIAQDGQVRGVQYDAEDRFCLDGQRLVVVDGTYGGDKSEYRTEVDTYIKVIASGQHGAGPASFRVWTKDGRILDYGTSRAGQIIVSGKRSVHQWNLEQITDRSGNNVTITYIAQSTSPSGLRYGTTSVIFKYETRHDQYTAYFNGGIISHVGQRLTGISIQNAAPMRQYTFDYHIHRGSKPSLLEAIRLCDAPGNCLKPLQFDYGSTDQLKVHLPDPSKAISDFGSGWTINEHPRIIQDVNGDGLADIIGFSSSCVKVSLNDGNGKFHPAECWVSDFGYTAGWRGVNNPRFLGDIDGDGLPDVVGFANDGVYVSFNTGFSFKSRVKLISEFGYHVGSWRTQNHLRFVLDINGDGRADIVGFHNTGILVALSKGKTFEPVGTWSNDFGYSSSGSWRIGSHLRFLKDVNGDRLPDVVGFGSSSVEVAINTGGSFKKLEVWLNDFSVNKGWSAERPRVLADVNGDGLADIVAFGTNGVYTSLSTGTSFTSPKKQLHSFGYSSSNRYRVGNHIRLVKDMTGDGLPDIVGFYSDGVHVSCNRGNGTFSPQELWLGHFGYSNGGWRVATHPRHLEDINGDGLADVVGFASGGVMVSLNDNSRPIIREFTDSFNTTQSISHMTLPLALHEGHYTKTNSAKYPIQSPVLPINIVTKVTQNKGTTAANTTSYFYIGFRVDVSGRGSQGFKWEKQTDSNNRSVIMELEQEFPFTGKTRRIQNTIRSETGKDVIISETDTTYTAKTQSPVFDVIPTKEVSTMHELDGSLVSELEITYTGTNGYGGPLQITSLTSGGGQTFTEKTVNIYRDDVDAWLIGLVVSSKVTHSSSCVEPITRHVTYEYAADTGYLTRQTVEPDHELALMTNFRYDQFGNVVVKTETPVQGKGYFRRITTTFDRSGIFKKTSSNGKGHLEQYEHDGSTGNLVALTGGNGLNTTWTYDNLGRKVGEQQADGTVISWFYDWDQTIPGAMYHIQIISKGSPTKTRIYDALDRLIREETVGFDNYDIYEDVTYNKEGLVHKHSSPHFTFNHPSWTVFYYDILGRVIREERPGPNATIAVKSTLHDGLRIKHTDALGHVTLIVNNALGKLVKVTDHLGGSVSYTYDAVGNTIQTTGPDGYETNIKYDLLGHKSKVDDPNMGEWKYKHNAFGELVWQEYAKQNIVTLEYDVLGRLVKRAELEGTTTWTYDNQPHGLGKLGNVQGPDGYSRTWHYDEYGRENKLTTNFKGQTFDINTLYDRYGRISRQQYPNGESLYRRYSDIGHLLEVGLGASHTDSDSKLAWKALAYDSLGQVIKEKYGNDLITNYEYNLATHLVGITTHKDGGNTLRHLRYTYDLNDNLLSRRDLVQAVEEHFAYDKLDRITQSTIVVDDGEYQRRQNWDYQSNGNIQFNDAYGLGPFKYHRNKPHAVIKAGNHTYSYDANGNAILKDGKTIHWTSYNKPSRFETENGNICFHYGPDRSRYMTISANGEQTMYLGKTYEVHTINNVSTSKVFVYGAMGRLVAIMSKNMSEHSTSSVSYVHTDNMGSVDTVSHENSEVVERLNYDAFGMRRAGNWMIDDIRAEYSVRGYTGHEHLPELGLIHMNGRVYDPEIGRFLSPDPHVQDPTNTQAFNRYSYALNNPLKHNDPSGYFWKRLKKFAKKIWGPALAIAVSIVATPIAAGLVAGIGLTGTTAAVATGVMAGAVSGFAGGTVATGSIKGGLQGAAGGAIFGAVGGYFGSTWNMERVVARAAAGGVVKELGGGKFKDGFTLAGVAAGARHLYNSVVAFDVDPRPGGPAVEKTLNQRPVAGANNIGIQGEPPDPSWFDKNGINWREGSGINRLLNRVPGVNAVAGLHDTFQTNMDTVFFQGARDVFNVPGMLPAAAITYTALLDGPGMPTLLVDETRRNKK